MDGRGSPEQNLFNTYTSLGRQGTSGDLMNQLQDRGEVGIIPEELEAALDEE